MYANLVNIDGKKKTIITNDWLKEFPEFKKTKPSVMNKFVGPLLLNLSYDIHRQAYEPGICAINFLNARDGLHLNLLTIPESRRSAITWAQHEKGLYKEASEELRRLFYIPLSENVKLSQIIHAYKNYNGNIFKSYFYEDPALIAAWCGRPELAQELLDWGMAAFQEHYQVPVPLELETFENWYTLTQKRIQNPDALRTLLGDEIKRFKLEKVPYQDIIVDL